MFIRMPFRAVAVAVLLAYSGQASAADVGQSEKIDVTPPQGKVGTRFTFVCRDFPEPTQRDTVYVVPAGTPDIDPYSSEAADVKVLWKDYAANCYRNKGRFFSTAGPFAPGNYEVRFLTTLYNNDNRLEVSTRTAFSVK